MIRKTLGRGLDALIDNSPTSAPIQGGSISGAAAEGPFVSLPIDRIEPGKFQPRENFDPVTLEELRQSIAAQGIIEPLIVRLKPGSADRYQLIAGERRLRAAKLAKLNEVPAIVRELGDRAALEMSLVENLTRDDLNPIEEARALRRLTLEFDLSHDELASRIGKSRPYVTNAMRLLELPSEVLKMILSGRLSAGQARPLLAIPSGEAQIDAAQVLVERKVSARGAEAMAKKARAGKSTAALGAAEPNLEAMAETLRRALKRKVLIIRPRGSSRGHIELEFYDDNDLTALAAAITSASARSR